MSTLLIKNIGNLVTGDLHHPLSKASSLFIENGLIKKIGSQRTDADTIIDAAKLTVCPGLIDTHVHPTFGDFTPTQNSLGWMEAYMHGGVTTLVSAGELHVPGLPLHTPDPKLFRYLAVLAKRCSENGGQQPRLFAGTLMLVPGLQEEDFNEIADEGIRCVKFIFYPYGEHGNEAQRYVQWCREREIVVKIHTGGVSRSGLSRPAGIKVIQEINPDIAGHISGGPIPMPPDEIKAVVTDTECYLEIATGGNFRRTIELMETVHTIGAQGRVILGTDTPSGTGVTPRGMLRNIALLASLGGVRPEQALCIATGNAAQAHRLPGGIIQEGKPADLIIMGRINGSVGKDALDSLAIGDIPGITCVIIGGHLSVRGRSEQTPPPETLAKIEKYDDH